MIIVLIAILGLVVGSFLNVVIIRYPLMLKRKWHVDCKEYLNLPLEPFSASFNLAMPASHCPNCRNSLPFWHNIPILSFLALRGRCGFCQEPISWQYPFIEMLTAVATLAVFLEMGLQIKTVAVWIMSWSLIVLAGVDWKTQLLPDDITLPLLWLGLILNITSMFCTLPEAVLGAALGYALLWLAANIFQWIRKKPGMGNGDFKMLAMIGAWVGTTTMLHTLVLAIILSLAVNLSLLLFKKITYQQPLPFGPWLAVAGWFMMVFNPYISNWNF